MQNNQLMKILKAALYKSKIRPKSIKITDTIYSPDCAVKEARSEPYKFISFYWNNEDMPGIMDDTKYQNLKKELDEKLRTEYPTMDWGASDGHLFLIIDKIIRKP